MQDEENDDDLFNSSDEESPDCNSDQEIREAADKSVVQETCRGASCNVNACNYNDASPRASEKVEESEYSKNTNMQQIDKPLKKDTGNPSPNDGLDDVAKNDPITLEDAAQIEETHLAVDEVNTGESPLLIRGISGKLKKLLSRNTPLSKKLKDAEEEITSDRSTRAERDNCVKNKTTTWHQSEPRATRTQTRRRLEINRRITRATSRISSSSEGSFLSKNVSHWIEEIGESLGFREDKVGKRAPKKVYKNGAASGNP
ncbi:hypothetical protein L2E82_47949 [Cichorium intybus]|uniref:Uncharacterized protein n=1 Tax=Cichorium intybus TaxID=13427 RepID=A0ACB8YW57_CICIN|nr:hypothetical protein L2E82_47949 [Cichorium intybus]